MIGKSPRNGKNTVVVRRESGPVPKHQAGDQKIDTENHKNTDEGKQTGGKNLTGKIPMVAHPHHLTGQHSGLLFLEKEHASEQNRNDPEEGVVYLVPPAHGV